MLRIDGVQREYPNAKPMTAREGPMNIRRGAVKVGCSMGRARPTCSRCLRQDAFVTLLRLAPWLDAKLFPQCCPAPLVFAHGLLRLAEFRERTHQGAGCAL